MSAACLLRHLRFQTICYNRMNNQLCRRNPHVRRRFSLASSRGEWKKKQEEESSGSASASYSSCPSIFLKQPRFFYSVEVRAAKSPSETLGSAGAGQLPHWVQTPVELEIFKAQTPEDLIQICDKYRLSARQSVSLSSCLAKVGGQNYFLSGSKSNMDSIRKLKRTLDAAIAESVGYSEHLPVGDTILALRSLLFLGMDPSMAAVEHLQKSLLNTVNLINPRSLIGFATFHVQYKDSTEASSRLQAKLERRLKVALNTTDAVPPEQLLLVMSKLPYGGGGLIRTEWQRLVEKHAALSVRSMNASQCVRLLVLLEELGSRNMGVVKLAVQQLVGEYRTSEIPMKNILSLLNVCTKLSLQDSLLREKIMKDLNKHLDDAEQWEFQTVGCLFSSLGQLHWRDPEVLEKLCTYMDRNLENLKMSDHVPVVLTLAKCNFLPREGRDFVRRIRDRVIQKSFVEEFGPEPTKQLKARQIWLDWVWSLGILNELTEELASTVLNKQREAFIQSLIDPSNSKAVVNKQKLKNIEGCLKLDLGVNMSNEIADCLRTQPDPKEFFRPKSAFQAIQRNLIEPGDMLRATVHHIAPRETHSKMQSWSEFGYFLDAEFVVGKEKRPLAVKDWGETAEEIKICVILWTYGDFAHGRERYLTGDNSMRRRHLSRLGYHIIEVPYLDLKMKRKFSEKVEYVKEMLEGLIS